MCITNYSKKNGIGAPFFAKIKADSGHPSKGHNVQREHTTIDYESNYYNSTCPNGTHPWSRLVHSGGRHMHEECGV